MHIVDGALSTPVLVAGGVMAVAGIAVGLRTIDADRMPQVGVLSAVFFVASLVHVPVGPSSVHLILNGLIGLVLGWAAFPALLIALLLQAVFFGFGGITVLGVNTVAIALPAVACFYLFGPLLRNGRPGIALAAGVAAGAGAIALTCLTVGLALAFSGEEFLAAAKLVFFAHLPVMAVEGVLTGAAVTLMRKVKPEMLALAVRTPT
ncbi:MAG: cobalt transporter CbiM [Rhodospirillales bacterium]|nr:cobalt transporter CbiM [Rhodospirillales bacterium]